MLSQFLWLILWISFPRGYLALSVDRDSRRHLLNESGLEGATCFYYLNELGHSSVSQGFIGKWRESTLILTTKLSHCPTGEGWGLGKYGFTAM